MRSQGTFYQRFGLVVAACAATLLVVPSVAAQALYWESVGPGTELLLVSQPLSDATTVAWPNPDGTVASFTSGRLTLAADLQSALTGLAFRPVAVIAVGGAQPEDIRSMLEISLAGGVVEPVQRATMRRTEGGVDRRLGAPGGDALLRLEVTLPTADDWRRSTVEVLWELLPELLVDGYPGLISRIDDGVGRLEVRIDPDLAEVRLRELRLQLSRLAEDVRLDESLVEGSRRRLQVRRHAQLGNHPEGAELVARLWLDGGVVAVREFLFGAEGVTLETVRAAARQWLPQHPGSAVLVLPPRVFNPRFAPGPERVQLPNDVVAAVLERPAAGLSVVCLQPVLVPDLDGELTGTVLTRLAAELRSSEGTPGWVRVRARPPLLELAAPSDGFAELIEALQRTLARVAEDDRTIASSDQEARRRALDLMSRLLGLADSVGMSPAGLLQPSNLAVGVVAPDAESAIEALGKFGVGGTPSGVRPAARAVAPVPRTREAAAGGESVVVVSVELMAGGNEVSAAVVAELISERSAAQLGDAHSEVLRPFVPGRTVLLLVVRAPAALDELERRVQAAWAELAAPATEDELVDLRRRLAAQVASENSGPLGHARRCAAVAAGYVSWRLPSELELELLTTTPEAVTEVMSEIASWDRLQTTGAGVLPIPEPDRP